MIRLIAVVLISFLLISCSGSKIKSVAPLVSEHLDEIYNHQYLIKDNVSFDRLSFKYFGDERKYNSGRTQYIYFAESRMQPLILSSTTYCMNEAFVSGYLFSGKKRYLEYVENKTNSIVNLIDDRWLSDKSFLYEVVSERELIGYVYIGADGCKIYEIGLVNLNIDLITFKRLISNFTYNQS